MLNLHQRLKHQATSACRSQPVNGHDIALDSWVTQFENILTQSLTEHSLHDFKQGFWTLANHQRFDDDAFKAVLQTLSAMANHGSNATGYVIVGVADKEADSKRVQQIHDIKAGRFRNFFVTGIEHEAGLGGKTLDDYITWLLEKVRNSELDPRLIDDICRDARLIRYYDKAVLVLRSYSASVEAAKTNISLRKFTCHNRTYHPGARSTLGWQAIGWCVLAAQDTRGIATQAE